MEVILFKFHTSSVRRYFEKALCLQILRVNSLLSPGLVLKEEQMHVKGIERTQVML